MEIKNNQIIKGTWHLKHIRDGKVIYTETGENIIPYEGSNRILNSLSGATSLPDTWYINLFKNNITPSLTDTAANALGSTGTYGECSDSDLHPQNNRLQITFGTASNGSMSSTNTLQFIAQQSQTIYGGFVTNIQTKMNTSGVLLSAKRFSTPRSVIQDDIIQVSLTYTITST